MIRINKTPPPKLHRNTAFSRFLARPAIRFGIAGFMSFIITFLLFIFMMYITQNFTSGSSMASQMLFDLEMVDMRDKQPPGRVRVPRPAGIAETPEIPGLTDIQNAVREHQQSADATEQDDSGGDNKIE